jgi:predicted nucleic acid-binding protein
MNGKKDYLFDTDILIYFLAGKLPEHTIEKIEEILGYSFNISVITKIEILGWKGHTEESFRKTQEFIKDATIFGLEEKIVEEVIKLRRNKKIKIPDAIIAATARVYNKILITNNEKDFKFLTEVWNPLKEH